MKETSPLREARKRKLHLLDKKLHQAEALKTEQMLQKIKALQKQVKELKK